MICISKACTELLYDDEVSIGLMGKTDGHCKLYCSAIST